MNICVDIRPLMGGKHTGVEIYTLNLLENLFKIDRKNHYILFANAEKDQSQYLPKFQQDNVTTIQTKIPNKILNLSLAILKRPRLDLLVLRYLQKHPQKQPKNFDPKKGIEIFFMPDLRPSAISKSVKKITVVHDLSFQHFPHFFSHKTRLWYKLLNAKKELQSSHKIITVSNFTKKDVIQTYQIPTKKITVIHEAVNDDFGLHLSAENIKKARRKYNLPSKYFLTLSTLEPRKNLAGLLKAFHQFKESNPDNPIKLVVAGTQNTKIFSEIDLQNKPDVVMTGFIKEEDKAIIYHQAKAFLYISFYEGFGLPLVEAMKCQTPIIASWTSAMPEIVGDAALLINPYDTYAMTQAMQKIQEPETQTKLKKSMEIRIKKFSWQKCAQETMQLFSD